MIKELKLLSLCLLLAALSACTTTDTSVLTEEPSVGEFYEEQLEKIDQHVSQFQFAEVDSLAMVVREKALADSNFVVLTRLKILEVTAYLTSNRYDEALDAVYEAVDLAEKTDLLRYRVMARKWLADTYNARGEYDKDLDIINDALEMLGDAEIPDVRVAVVASRAGILRNRDRNSEALRDYLRVIDTINELGHQGNLAVIYNSIGLIYIDKNDHESALEYFQMAYEINRERNAVHNLSTNYNNMSLALAGLERHEEAIDTLHAAIRFNTRHNLPFSVIRNMFNLSTNYSSIGDLDNARNISLEGLSMSRGRNFRFGKLYHTNALAKVYKELGDFETALEYANESYELSSQIGVKSVQASMSGVLSAIYEHFGDYQSALEYYQEYHTLNEELTESRRSTELEELIVNYNVEQQEAENLLLQQNLEFQEALNRNQTIILALLLLGVIVTAILLIIVYFKQRRLRALLSAVEDQNNDIARKNEELERLNNDRNALIGVIVHDLKNPLSSITGLAEVMGMNKLDDENRSLLEMIDVSAKKMQSMVDNLLDVNRIEKKNIEADYEVVETRNLIENILPQFRMQAAKKLIVIEEKVENFKVYTHKDYVTRILDNLISNAIKFSPMGTNVQIEIEKTSKLIWRIVVDDEGPGISENEKNELFKMFSQLSTRPTGGESSSGIGLYTVSLLSKKLGGGIKLENKEGQGARFVCTLPLHSVPGNEKKIKSGESTHKVV